MARKRRYQEEPEPEVDLTPMIDIVFNLIIFFMIVSELSNLTVEQLELSFADQAMEPKKLELAATEKVLQINVLPGGLIKVKGNPYTADPKQKDRYPWLADFLEVESAGYEREDPDPSNPQLAPSKMRVNIRADKEAPFMRVQQVFDACQKHGIYKTSLAATKDNPEKG